MSYSREAKRRYKKQLQQKAGEKAVQANTRQTKVAADTPRTEEGSHLRWLNAHDWTQAHLILQAHNRAKSPKSLSREPMLR
jgi:hypothetical protein